MLYSWLFAIFCKYVKICLDQIQAFPGFRWNFRISKHLSRKSVIRKLVRTLSTCIFLVIIVRFHLWRQITLKRGKIYKYFFLLVLTSLKMHRNSLPHKHCLATIGTAFISKLALNAKMQNTFWISILRANGSSEIMKYTENANSRGLVRIRNENVFLQYVL